ncbi:MAG: family 6 glucosyltransferase [bacterium]
MKIAVLYIGLGRYTVFWEGFYKSCEQFFLPKHEKTYFVFTDNESLMFEKESNVVKIHQENLKFPYATLLRFEMFSRIRTQLKEFDYIFFLNGNMEFVDFVNEECLPTKENDGLVAGLLLARRFFNNPDRLPYERNPLSNAYIPYGKGTHYLQGGLNGGMADEYLEMIDKLNVAIKEDLANGIIAVVNDESHLNKYLLDKNPLILEPNYMYSDQAFMEEYKKNKKIVVLNKQEPKWGGMDYLRGKRDKPIVGFEAFICSIILFFKKQYRVYVNKFLY